MINNSVVNYDEFGAMYSVLAALGDEHTQALECSNIPQNTGFNENIVHKMEIRQTWTNIVSHCLPVSLCIWD